MEGKDECTAHLSPIHRNKADQMVACFTGLLGSAYDTAANTAHSAVATGAGLVEKTANYIGDTAAK